MSRFSKALKTYERQILLALVILLLVSFSVLGAVQCGQEAQREVRDYSGTFQASPTEKVTIPSGDFVQTLNRYNPYLFSTLGAASLRYQYALGRIGGPDLAPQAATWAHLMTAKAAEAAGYRVGKDYQLKLALRRAIRPRMETLQQTDALYDLFLREYYRLPASDFERTVSEVVQKDQFLTPLIESQRYAIPYEEAYEDWKTRTEYVDLDYVALRGSDFALEARRVENTRTAIQAQRDALRGLDRTARAIERLDQRIERYRQDHEEALPADLAALEGPERALLDAWERPLRYTVEDGAYTITSDGPDGEPGTADDVDAETVAELATLDALRRVGDALQAWHEKKGAWPETLDALLEAPTEDSLAPLAREEKDGWDQPLLYDAPDGEDGAPALRSAGPDGEPGGEDDLAAVFEAERFVVTPGPRTAVALDPSLRDAWDRPLRVRFQDATTRSFDLRSAGADGAFDTDDDVETGNEGALRAFYDRPGVRVDYLLPTTRRFRAIYVQLPLVPDDVFARLWEAFPEYHPDEQEAYRRWLLNYGEELAYYTADDPADAEAGHGAELARRLAPNDAATLVPSREIFGEAPDDLGGEEDPDLATYLEKGWREILLREEFFEAMLNDQLRIARESHEAHGTWEAARAAFEAGEGEDPGEAPERVTFEGLLAGVFAPFLPGEADPPYLGFYETEKPLTRAEIEAIPTIGSYALTQIGFQGLAADDQFAAIPLQLNDALTKAILQNVELQAERQPELEEVRDEVFERYLETRALDLAADALDALREEVQGTQRAEEGVWEERFGAWKETVDAPIGQGTTGMFIGNRPPASREVSEGMAEAEALAIQRQDFVRQTGYESVRPMSTEGDVGTEVGAFGRTVLRDEASDSAFLVRVRDRQEPPPEAFSPRDYRRYVITKLLDPRPAEGQQGSARPRSPYLGAMYRYFLDVGELAKTFRLETEAELDGSDR